MKYFRPTVLFMVLVTAVITVYDVWALATGGPEHTISWTITTASHTTIAIPFLFGFLAGHLFGSSVDGAK